MRAFRRLFESSSAVGDMSSVSDEYIKNLKLVLENNPTAKVEVTGHTDSTGTDWFNNKLGLQRAEFVRSYLVNAGINTGSFRRASASQPSRTARVKGEPRTEEQKLK